MTNKRIELQYVRHIKQLKLLEWLNAFELRLSELAYTEIDDAVLLPMKKDENTGGILGGVLDTDGNAVLDSFIQGRIGGKYCYPSDIETINEELVFGGFFTKHWGHFLIETIPRLWYVISHSDNVNKIAFLVYEGDDYEATGNFRAFFELLGISERIVWINSACKVKRVIIPELSYKRMQYYAEPYNSIFDTIIDQAINNATIMDGADRTRGAKYPERIFLSRGHFATRKKEIGLLFLDDYFRRNRFEIVYPEELPLAELIRLMLHAETIACESGSGAHNLLFAPKGKEVIIVERQALPNEIQINLDVIRNHNVTYIDACYALYPTDASAGPFWLHYTDEMERFTSDSGYSEPNQKYMTSGYCKKCAKQYIKIYRQRFGWMVNMRSDLMYGMDCICECAEQTLKKFPYMGISLRKKIKNLLKQ